MGEERSKLSRDVLNKTIGKTLGPSLRFPKNAGVPRETGVAVEKLSVDGQSRVELQKRFSDTSLLQRLFPHLLCPMFVAKSEEPI